mgnify:CR=1 FL=1
MGTQKSPRVAAMTLGCKVNQYDTEALLETFAAHGFTIVEPDQEAEVYLINTCTVTNIADKKSRQLIRKVIRTHPHAVVAAFGCYAQTQAEQLIKIPGLAIVLGTQNREQLVEIVTTALQEKHIIEPQNLVEPLRSPDFEELAVSNFGSKVRAVLKVQEGCQQFCSYCKVPYARGPERSRSLGSVLNIATSLVEAGYKEIVLTGIHLAAYGADLDPRSSLEEIVAQVVEIPGLQRLRLSSVEPTDVTDGLLQLMATHPKVCPHLHLPLQSGSTTVLQRMRRKYTTTEYLAIVEKARDLIPDLAVTTDIIVGFPGETAAEFAETLAFVETIGFSRLHVFPYSRRAGTPAAKMSNQLAKKVKEERSQTLIRLGQHLAESFHRRYLGSRVQVLIEEVTGGVGTGYTENYIRVQANLPRNYQESRSLTGEISTVLVNTVDFEGAMGEILC